MTETGHGAADRTLGDHLAETVHRIREERRLSLSELARQLSEVGFPITRMGVQRLERGERRVNVDEVLALALVLDVPPILLLFPVGLASEVQLVPGRSVETWTAAQWFMGARTDAVSTDPPSAEWAIVGLYRKHDEMFMLFDEAYSDLVLYPPAEGDPEKRIVQRRVRLHLRDLRLQRAAIRRRGLTPPPLPPDLAEMVDNSEQFFISPDELAGILSPERVWRPEYMRPVDFSERADDPTTWKDSNGGKEG